MDPDSRLSNAYNVADNSERDSDDIIIDNDSQTTLTTITELQANDVDMQDSELFEDMPPLHDVSDSSDDEDDSDNDMQTSQPPSIDPQPIPLPTLTQPQPQVPPVINRPSSNRRARVEDDHDDERDRRHPSQRVDSTHTTPTSSSSAGAGPSSNSQTQPAFQHRPFPNFLLSGGSGPNAPPFRFFQHLMGATGAGPSSPNTTATPTGNGTPQHQQPQPEFVGGISFTVDLLGSPSPVSMAPQAPQSQPQDPTQPTPAATPQPQTNPASPPNADADGRRANLADLLARVGAFTQMFGIGAGGLGLEEKDDPERAAKLVEGLDDVPVGLVKRLVRVGGSGGGMGEDETKGGDAGCAICWDSFLLETAESSTELVEQPRIVSLPCAHVFHADCLIPWFSRPRQTTCPTCRFNIDPDNLTYVSWRQRRREQHEREEAEAQRMAEENANGGSRSGTPTDSSSDRSESGTEPLDHNPSQANPLPRTDTPTTPPTTIERIIPVPIVIPITVPASVLNDGNAPGPIPQNTPPATNAPTRGAGLNIPNPSNVGDYTRFLSRVLGRDPPDIDYSVGGFFPPGLPPYEMPRVDSDPQQHGTPLTQPTNAVPGPQSNPTPADTPAPAPTLGTNPRPGPQARAHFGTINMGNGMEADIISVNVDVIFSPPSGDERGAQPQQPRPFTDFFRSLFPVGAFSPQGPPGNETRQQFMDLLRGRAENGRGTPPQPAQTPGQPAQPQQPHVQAQARPMPPRFDDPLIQAGHDSYVQVLEQARAHIQAQRQPQPAGDNEAPAPTANPQNEGANGLPGGASLLDLLAILAGPPIIFATPQGHEPAQEEQVKRPWTLPPAPGPTLRQRIERREQEAGLRCCDISCGVGPSDEDPELSTTESQLKQLFIKTHDGKDVCSHTFHSACLVSAERVASRGADVVEQNGEVEVSCPVCRGVGCVLKEEWKEGVDALS